MFTSLRTALARNASLLTSARGAKTAAKAAPASSTKVGKAWAVDLIKEEVGKVGKAAITKAQAEAALEALIGGIKSSVASGQRVTFQGFGSFTPVTKASRMVQTPKGVKMQLPERKGLRFKISSEFKSAVQGK
ncbi:uncharacterized protein MICPUCDRAFT_50393 [Micromonas pusilla CCMP1545]|jgi:DNA-binding protein HU-beta|uniref:Predicted protein n=1 Tax=Micromonas pusilla (strain CCMP1545) TaxID=564608 RepID=C1MI10_MICPC|nr:uncharacterized protein MICPUCDRAFT_50393 [Micromonas pusilla CCMP1545]EEH60301.1 predicted protein [Micromonas pusilla CCMP1545]|tara:strand:- start:415 stop:813 length:399 start_codon:yes stop_codon:yes gene_type:complete|mmetsp:Transcript_171386/g.416728  ORF Transcript_171386/g.416728 Transcript_171386/m.416728 type:complete len:133 (-) Transcript_171386:107-505(-)|eukprot:XP_003055049.1 predicted protein [Micromonas pusilla CCMP1545]